MLILPGRGFPLFSSRWFFYSQAGPGRRTESSCSCRGRCLSSARAPLHDPARLLFPSTAVLGCPCLLLLPGGCGHHAQGVTGCPQHGDAVPGTHLVPGVGSWAFGLALGNSPPKGEEGRGPWVVPGQSVPLWGPGCAHSTSSLSPGPAGWQPQVEAQTRTGASRAVQVVSECLPWVCSLCPSPNTSGAAVPPNGQEMVETRWEVGTEPTHSCFGGDF